MAIQDQSVGTRSRSVLQGSNEVSLSSGLHSVTGAQFRDRFSSGNDYATKVRKPYTITKQRERWSEEEHKKFLDALKMYGRAWRRIEEHVGSKTAVQIRSHAQKFFSKQVVRDSNGSNTSSEPIEIPPPRPKRKPMHPYPRKLVIPPNKEISTLEQPLRSASPNLSVSERENHSPTSVLSAVGSEAVGSPDLDSPNNSLSPVSSAADVQLGGLVLPKPNQSTDRSASPSPALMTVGSVSDQQLPVKFELFPKENACIKEVTSEEASPRQLKLFGRTVLVTDSHRPSCSIGTSKPIPADMHEEKVVEPLPVNYEPVKSMPGNTECVWSHLPHVPNGALNFMQCQTKSLNLLENSSAAPIPWWTFCGGLPLPFMPFHKADPLGGAYRDSALGEVHDKEVRKEGSWTGSNTGSMHDWENGDRCSDAETQSRPFFLRNKNQERSMIFQFRPSEKSAFSDLRTGPEKCVKGFVPYKRCMAERETQSSTITGQEGDEKRIRLCL